MMVLRRYGRAVFSCRRIFWSAPLAALALVVVAACASSSGDGSTSSSGSASASAYTLACLGDFSGPLGFSGLPVRNGFETYVASVNKAGGVDGHKVNVLALDDTDNVTTGKTNYQQAVSSHALGTFCENGGIWASLAPFAAPSQTMQMGLAVTDNYTDPVHPYIYRATFGSIGLAQEQIGFVKYLISQGKLPAHPTVGLIYFTDVVTQGMDTYFQTALKQLGWKIVADQQFPLTATSATTQSSAVASAKPDVVLSMLTDPSGLFVDRELRQQGFKGPNIEFTGANGVSTFQALDDPEYFSQSVFAYPGDTEVPAAVTELQQSKTFGFTQSNTSSFFSAGYVMAITAIDALKKCGNGCNSVSYNNALNDLGTVNVFGLAPGVSITPSDHQIVNSGQFYVWDSAKNAVVKAGPPITVTSK
jgi:branched-chain amino acid transport system substrate-binding protein